MWTLCISLAIWLSNSDYCSLFLEIYFLQGLFFEMMSERKKKDDFCFLSKYFLALLGRDMLSLATSLHKIELPTRRDITDQNLRRVMTQIENLFSNLGKISKLCYLSRWSLVSGTSYYKASLKISLSHFSWDILPNWGGNITLFLLLLLLSQLWRKGIETTFFDTQSCQNHAGSYSN